MEHYLLLCLGVIERVEFQSKASYDVVLSDD